VKPGGQPPLWGRVNRPSSGTVGAVAAPTLYAFVVGAGLLALWIDVRRPKLAPESFSKRIGAAACAWLVLEFVPVFNGSATAIYATLFALLLPALVWSSLTAVWLMRAMRDAQTSH
jgi:hypothetical protein